MRKRLYPAVDSNALTYLVDAIGNEAYDFDLDKSKVAVERRAMAWCLFFGDSWPWVGPTVQVEYKKIRAVERLDTYDRWTKYHLQDQPLTVPEHVLQRRADELLPHHNRINDCRVVVETEFAGLHVLLSIDRDMRRLQPHTKVRILRPTEFWVSLGITNEPDVVNMPARGNPLRSKTWWRFPK